MFPYVIGPENSEDDGALSPWQGSLTFTLETTNCTTCVITPNFAFCYTTVNATQFCVAIPVFWFCTVS